MILNLKEVKLIETEQKRGFQGLQVGNQGEVGKENKLSAVR